MTEKKAPIKKDDATRLAEGKVVEADDLQDILRQQAEAMMQIAANSIPTDTQAILKKMDDEHESPYVLSDQVAVLTVSTADLMSIDGWPGYIDEKIPGQFTKQHLQKRLRMPIEIVYDPSLMRSYSLEFMDKAEFDKIEGSSPGGAIPKASMVASMALRAGDHR